MKGRGDSKVSYHFLNKVLEESINMSCRFFGETEEKSKQKHHKQN